MSSEKERKEKMLIGLLQPIFQKIISTDGSPIDVVYTPTDFVTSGGLFTCRSKSVSLEKKIWVGINGPRLFFIVYVDKSDIEEAKNIFNFCFGGAKRVGWDFYYERVNNDVLSIWGTLMTDRATPLVSENPNLSKSGRPALDATEEGLFFLTDIAIMAQSFIRTCERHLISAPPEMNPAPL